MDGLDIVFILLAYVVAAFVKGLTGVGFATTCLPIIALRLDLKVAIPLVIIPSMASNIAVMVQAGDFRKTLRQFWPLYASSIPGLFVGLMILVAINVGLARLFLGLVLISYTLLALSNKPFVVVGEWTQKLKVPIGFSTGFVSGLTGSQVIPVLPYLLALNLDKNTFVQACNISFTISNIVMLFGMKQFGFLSYNTIVIGGIGLIPVLTIVYLSGKLQQYLSLQLFRKLVLYLLLFMGLVLSVKGMIT